MYPVSEDYLEAIEKSTTTTYWYGQIKAKNGVLYSFTEDDIDSGSGRITREISSGEDLEIGSTCAAGLDLSLYLDANRYELYGAEVKLFYMLKLDSNSWETIPLGVFYIEDPPERDLGVLSIHAYDAMMRFNKDFGSTLIGNPYYMLQYACNACNVELGNTQSEIANMPNGSVDTYTYEEATISTYKDLISYIATFLGGYAYIGVDGKLYIAQYSMEPVRTIDSDWRYDYKPTDYETYYTALTAFFMVTEEEETYSTGASGGLTYDIGSNPLIQFNLDATRSAVLNNILNALSSFTYTPFKASTPCDPALMVGDVLNFTDNHAVDGKLSVITKQIISIKGGMELECSGADPNLNVLTKVQKSIKSVAKSNNKDAMYYYDFINAGSIHADDGETVKITEFNYITTKATHVDYHGQVKLVIDTTEIISEDMVSCYENDGVIKVTYKMDDSEVKEYYPVDTFTDGEVLLDLLYFFYASGNLTGVFSVYLTCEGCSFDIESGAARGYIAGAGLVGDSAWDGSVKVEDNFYKFNFSSRMHKQMTDELVSVAPQVPNGDTFSQNYKRISFSRILKSLTSAVGNVFKLHKFTVPYNAGEVTLDNTKVSDDKWVLDNTSQIGMVTTPNKTASTILYVKTINSGLNVFYIVSFDSGTTWWTYNNGWVAPDYTQDVYGMFKSTMEAITQAQWATKFTGNIMIRAVLIDSIASLTNIEIFTEEVL